MRELSDDECMAIAGPECTVLSSFGYELVRAAYAAGYAAAQSGPPDHQPAATPSAQACDAQAESVCRSATDGPAADPIDYLCARLYSLAKPHTYMLREEAAVVIERLRAERDEARRECVEQARLLGISGSREAAQAVTDGPAADHQRETTSNDWGAMMEASKRAAYEAASAVTDGLAADPIADLIARARHYGNGYGGHLATVLECADALERLARERDVLSDTLAAIVRAAWKEEA